MSYYARFIYKDGKMEGFYIDSPYPVYQLPRAADYYLSCEDSLKSLPRRYTFRCSAIDENTKSVFYEEVND